MGCAVHLWTGFVSVICYGTFLPTLPGFTPHHRMMTHAGVSGEAFQGVTLSFHLLNYQFTELIKNSAVRRLFSGEQVAQLFMHCVNSSASIWGIPKEKMEEIWPQVHHYLAQIPEEEMKIRLD